MYEREVEITADIGLDTRPAAQFVYEAKSFEADITVTCDGKTASARSLFKLQELGIVQGSRCTISAIGPEEEEAVNHLVALLEELHSGKQKICLGEMKCNVILVQGLRP